MQDPTRRFSARVENYIKYRPRYPEELISYLQGHTGLTPMSKVADIGSGTGIFSALLLERGCTVYGVEPNAEMRSAAEQLMGAFERFHSVDGRAEDTTLPNASVDLITVAQAFHWLDRDQAKQEFLRILKPTGMIAIIWNSRQRSGTPFLDAYEDLLMKYGTDYREICHNNVTDETLEQFYAPYGCSYVSFPNVQILDWEGLRGRVLSSSYVPLEGHPDHALVMAGLREIFEQHQEEGRIQLVYESQLYLGMLTP